MIELTNKNFEIKKINDDKKEVKNKVSSGVMTRPSVVDAKVYKLKSAFVKNSVLYDTFITTRNCTTNTICIF